MGFAKKLCNFIYELKDDRVIVYGKDTHHVSLLRMRGALAGALGAFSQKTTYAGQQ